MDGSQDEFTLYGLGQEGSQQLVVPGVPLFGTHCAPHPPTPPPQTVQTGLLVTLQLLLDGLCQF